MRRHNLAVQRERWTHGLRRSSRRNNNEVWRINGLDVNSGTCPRPMRESIDCHSRRGVALKTRPLSASRFHVSGVDSLGMCDILCSYSYSLLRSIITQRNGNFRSLELKFRVGTFAPRSENTGEQVPGPVTRIFARLALYLGARMFGSHLNSQKKTLALSQLAFYPLPTIGNS